MIGTSLQGTKQSHHKRGTFIYRILIFNKVLVLMQQRKMKIVIFAEQMTTRQLNKYDFDFYNEFL